MYIIDMLEHKTFIGWGEPVARSRSIILVICRTDIFWPSRLMGSFLFVQVGDDGGYAFHEVFSSKRNVETAEMVRSVSIS